MTEDSYSYVSMPVNKRGKGPVDPATAFKTRHEVWRMSDNATVATCSSKEDAELITTALNVHVRALKLMKKGRELLEARNDGQEQDDASMGR